MDLARSGLVGYGIDLELVEKPDLSCCRCMFRDESGLQILWLFRSVYICMPCYVWFALQVCPVSHVRI
jgi:hypothetical protein